jgi:hypothetical protein
MKDKISFQLVLQLTLPLPELLLRSTTAFSSCLTSCFDREKRMLRLFAEFDCR